MSIARVEPLVTARALRGPFDYRLPERLGEVGVGSLLLVPFGRQRLLGVVVELAGSSELPAERLAEPIAALEAGAPAELVRLGLWVAREYCSTPARGLELVLPPRTGRGRAVEARVERRGRITPEGAAALHGGGRLGARQRAALELLAGGEELAAADILAAAGADGGVLRRLSERGLVALRSVEMRRRPAVTAVGAPASAVELNAAQSAAVEAIVAGLDGGRRELLLHGITGSGKTEVYLAASEAALQRGRGVIVLVPEIALTPQTMSRFRARLGDGVALLHSRLSAGERRDEWMRLRRGDARVCVGPRSAVFAPLDGLGLIVVDEEHDSSYKQEGDPRYDAREVARERARSSQASFVAGTATPRPESWLELERVELRARADGGPLPAVEVLDMRGRPGREGPLHPRTRAALAAVAREGGKAIVLVNRRGWSPYLECRSCGRAWSCPRCEVSLVAHRRERRLRCHHCGHSETPPRSCPDCGSVTLALHGAGTERVGSLLADLVEPMPVFRLDADTAGGTGGHARVLAAFDRAPAGVLVGTQMVAKGHDFPDVVLSVVLDADASLRFPDFRAEERTFALVAQLAGRSGRGERGGRVLVQTLAPAAAAIERAARHDAEGFVEDELARRRELGYPPFSHLIAVELSGPDLPGVTAAATRLGERIGATLAGTGAVLGPAPRFRVRDRHRSRLVVKASERPPAVDAVRAAIESTQARRALRGLRLSVDVDPQ